MDDKLLVALIGGGVSFVVTVAGLILNPISQRRLQELKQAQDLQISELKARLDEGVAERKAHRDYEYEARKRLYEEVQPLVVQIGLACEASFGRMANLAQTARLGHLGEGPDSWIQHNEYYIASTVHRLLLPGAYFQILREKTTQFDFQLDPKIASIYYLLRESYLALTQEFEFAAAAPALPYDPFVAESEALAHPAAHRRQGVATGRVDNALASMIVPLEGGRHRIRRLGELQDGMAAHKDDIAPALEVFFWLVQGFHPARRPVLWRIMCAQACVAYVLWRTVASGLTRDDLPQAIEAFAADPRTHAKFATSNEVHAVGQARETFAAVASVLVHGLSRRDLLD